MHRLFAALPVPDSIAERLLPLRTDIHGAKWRKREHFHITLCFYDKVTIEVAEEIANALEAVASPALDLEVSGVGWFGRKEPRAIYARIKEHEALNELAAKCRNIARKLGIDLGQDPFKPHITLAYCNETPLEEVMAWSEAYQVFQSERFMIDRFHLYESFTGHRRQSQYVPQADYQLF